MPHARPLLNLNCFNYCDQTAFIITFWWWQIWILFFSFWFCFLHFHSRSYFGIGMKSGHLLVEQMKKKYNFEHTRWFWLLNYLNFKLIAKFEPNCIRWSGIVLRFVHTDGCIMLWTAVTLILMFSLVVSSIPITTFDCIILMAMCSPLLCMARALVFMWNSLNAVATQRVEKKLKKNERATAWKSHCVFIAFFSSLQFNSLLEAFWNSRTNAYRSDRQRKSNVLAWELHTVLNI